MTAYVPCPRGACSFDAEVEPRTDDPLLHAVCPEGHDTALAPVVLDHLRQVGENGWDATHGDAGFDRCGQVDIEGSDP